MWAPLLVLLAIIAVAAVASREDQFPSDGSMDGSALYRDPNGPAVLAAQDPNQTDEQRLAAETIAAQPNAIWFTEPNRNQRDRISRLTAAAESLGQIPVFVIYGIPNRDCGLYSAGGASSGDEYLQWVRSLSRGINGRRATVIVEPDAVAQAAAGCALDGGPSDRYALLRDAVSILSGGDVRVYLDAGNATWGLDREILSDALIESGVKNATGISVNVSNHISTPISADFARDIARRVGVRHYVIDVSRNGAQVPVGQWCNSSQARLGDPPTTNTTEPGADAYLWIKQPGNSDGECGRGEPPAGTWWPDMAVSLAS